MDICFNCTEVKECRVECVQTTCINLYCSECAKMCKVGQLCDYCHNVFKFSHKNIKYPTELSDKYHDRIIDDVIMISPLGILFVSDNDVTIVSLAHETIHHHFLTHCIDSWSHVTIYIFHDGIKIHINIHDPHNVTTLHSSIYYSCDIYGKSILSINNTPSIKECELPMLDKFKIDGHDFYFDHERDIHHCFYNNAHYHNLVSNLIPIAREAVHTKSVWINIIKRILKKAWPSFLNDVFKTNILPYL
jgi:hypothetical protein